MTTVTVDGVDIAYTDTGGSGIPVLLIHAFPFHSGMWAPQIDALSDRYRLIAPDNKGFGKSGAPDDPAVYSVDSYAAEAEAVLHACGLDRAIVCGLSIGGYISFAMLRRNPHLIAGLVLADTRADADAPEVVERRAGQQATVRSEGIAPVADALVAGPLLSDETRAQKPDVVEHVRRLADNPAAGYIGALEAMMTRADSTGQLTGIDVPTLVVVGEHDAITPVEVARGMHELIGGSELVVIPKAAHLSNIEAPDSFNAALARWLAER
jgi:3-oxoadipate enol-lactonase